MSHISQYSKLQKQLKINKALVEALRDLVLAVKFVDEVKDFGNKEPNPCYEARVPVDFIYNAQQALKSAKEE